MMADQLNDADVPPPRAEFPLQRTWFDRNITLGNVRQAFLSGASVIRIACGFFTLRGWGLIRASTKDKQVLILVGIEEPAELRARAALVDAIMRDLATGLDRNRRSAVQDFVERIRAGAARVVDARAMDHHAKLYLVDNSIAIVTSANTTGRGFIEQIESGYVVDDPVGVTDYVQHFDAFFAAANDITADLLRALEKWLKLTRPWDVYLKTMLALESLPETSRTYKPPLSYQVDMITQTLRQLREHKGSLLVASTGLGKTVVATHVAIRLFEAGEITNVMVICPKAVIPGWKSDMRDAGLPCEYFIHQSFDRTDAERDTGLGEFMAIAQNSDGKRWLIIIDESHEFRRRFSEKMVDGVYQQRVERKAFSRLMAFVRKAHALVLELTGSPYAVEVNNINDQLILLPHAAPRRTLFDGGRDDERAWHIERTQDFVGLPVASQLTTPHVAKHYCHKDEHGLYLSFETQKRYVPRVVLHRVDIPLPWENEIAQILPLLRTLSRHPIRKTVIEVTARIAWSSSPWALHEVLKKVVNTPNGPGSYSVHFAYSRDNRRRAIDPILATLEAMRWEDDIKFAALCTLLQDILSSGRKAFVFCERLPTVVYLAQGIARALPTLAKIAWTVDQSPNGRYQLKRDKQIQKLIKEFSPTANAHLGTAANLYNLLFATDAHGVGLNMQDASVVINYDTAWTAIEPTQRAGRILRFWEAPRILSLYTFVPTVTVDGELRLALAALARRWQNLLVRHENSQKLTDLPVLPSGVRHDIYLPDTASHITMQSGDLDLTALLNYGDSEISPYFQHTSILQAHREEALQIPSDITSSKLYPGTSPCVYVLLKHGEKYVWQVYQPATGTLQCPSPADLLHLIAADETTPTALVDPDVVETEADACIHAWCAQSGVPAHDVERVCTLYLKPESMEDTIKIMLNRT